LPGYVGWMRPLRRLADAIGRGLVAGAVGTALMTLSSTVEARRRRREPSTAPADAAGKVLGAQPRDEAGGRRFSTIVHWGYGTSWGAARGLIDVAGLTGAPAAAAHFAAVWGGELAMLPALGVASPFWTWGGKEVAIDAFHHVVYATGTSLAYAALGRA
jgi:hypothetical protein